MRNISPPLALVGILLAGCTSLSPSGMVKLAETLREWMSDEAHTAIADTGQRSA